MKKIFFILVYFFLTLYLWTQDTVTFGIEENTGLNPYYILINEAYEQLGIRVLFEIIPPERILISSNEGLYDGEIVRTEGLETTYTNLIPVDVIICEINIYAYKLSSSLIASNDEIETAGIVRGHTGAERSVAKLPITIHKVNSFEQLFLMLQHGRIEAIIEFSTLIDPLLKEMDLAEDIVKIKPSLNSSKIYHYLHKKNKHIIPEITHILQEMKESGRIDDILNN